MAQPGGMLSSSQPSERHESCHPDAQREFLMVVHVGILNGSVREGEKRDRLGVTNGNW